MCLFSLLHISFFLFDRPCSRQKGGLIETPNEDEDEEEASDRRHIDSVRDF